MADVLPPLDTPQEAPVITHLLNRVLEVWRPEHAPDGSGGQTMLFAYIGDIAAKVDQPSATEKATADQWGAEHTNTVYFSPSADVARGDELRGDGETYRVLATISPSRNTYTKAPAERTEHEPPPEES
ncbi:head-tail adaptor protein [Actinocorallia sp. API 0066]|uniref:phage head completion protein n=1 Tax=Actinocorallia sp. API 0066 TaxID=2896846 RepID=UPI001E61772B|nr:head-tail adaptor protein [Actinocorallia sp. API 0066]MCD0450771.1 head-tail adaptor protein [Actinocorallia sp. API 0066]